jgi:hypothetical protein
VLALSILTQVTATFAQQHTHTLNITIDGEPIHTTDGALRHCTSHPFLNTDGVWVNAQDLQVGNEVVSADGNVGVVEAIERIDEPQMMYNLSVAVVATYLVGDGKWVVHNDDMPEIIQQLLDYAKGEMPRRVVVPRTLTPLEIAKLSRRQGIIEMVQWKRLRIFLPNMISVARGSRFQTARVPGEVF